MRVCLFGSLFGSLLSSLLLVACPAPKPAGEGEGEGAAAGEGEGEGAAGEGEGEGVLDPGTNIVVGVSLHIEDVARDGSEIAVLDNTGALSTVSKTGGPAPFPATGEIDVAKAEYHGNFLLAYRGLDSTGKVAATTDQRDITDATATITNVANMKINSPSSSDDGAHLYYEVSLGGGDEQLFLDGNSIVADASKEKVRFTPDNLFLVVGANVPDVVSGSGSIKFVQTFPLAGGAPVSLVADNASNETQVSRDGVNVVFGENENGNLCDVNVKRADGTGAVQLIRQGADDVAFKVTLDNTQIVYVVDSLNIGAIEAAGFDGGNRTTIKDAGAKDITTITSTRIVYAASIDATTNLEDLHTIGLDGQGDNALGSNAIDEGATSDGRFLVFRDSVANGLGTLRVFDSTTETSTHVADGVSKVSIASATKLVYLDSTGNLVRATLGSGVARGTISANVTKFILVPDSAGGDASNVAYTTDADGLWVAPL